MRRGWAIFWWVSAAAYTVHGLRIMFGDPVSPVTQFCGFALAAYLCAMLAIDRVGN